jgi:DNA gyrase subunit A
MEMKEEPKLLKIIKNFLLKILLPKKMLLLQFHIGFIKRFPVSGYRRQGRGGKGVTGAGTKEDDFIEHMFVASTHQYILFFTDKGRVTG